MGLEAANRQPSMQATCQLSGSNSIQPALLYFSKTGCRVQELCTVVWLPAISTHLLLTRSQLSRVAALLWSCSMMM